MVYYRLLVFHNGMFSFFSFLFQLVIALFAACTLAQEESAPTCRPPEEKFEAEEFSCEQQTEFPL